MNTNQLAEHLSIDYKTAQHHLKVLTQNRILAPVGEGYGVVYLPTHDMDATWDDFDTIAAKIAPTAPPNTTKSTKPSE